MYAEIRARDIFNACDPGLLHNVSAQYKEDWWSPKYNSLRELLRDTFITHFDDLTNHYTNLRKSIELNGIQNPIVITAGPPIWREPWMIPEGESLICESCGGSRLMIAQELDKTIPCIINDQIGVDGEQLPDLDSVVGCFLDKKYLIKYGPPVRVMPRRFTHMDKNYTMSEQQRCRRQAKQKQIQAAKRWSAASTKKSGG